MALADTAKLVASLTLEDKFTKPLAGADKALSGFERHAGTMSKVGDNISRGLGNLGRNVGLIGAAAAGFLAVQVTAGVSALVRLESAQAQTEAVLKSTKQVAGETADSIRNLAEKYESLNATIDDKVIQSGENVLLTFTNIRKQAFEPALAAALDLNQALGGGEEGLQGNMILVGKALNDPIRGLTALRRVGVAFSKAQEEQIKKLVAANDLYGAQKIILQELTTEFGGSFARAGDTTAGKFAKVKDAVEDAQIALATAFLPVIEKVADKLQTFLADPATISRIKDFGSTLASGLDRLISVGEKLPWAAIGSAFEFAGTASQAILDTFTKMPPWVQTAVLTGWGLNKLTGGALSGIVGALASGLVKGVLGINAGVVNINAASVNGGVPGVGPTGGGPTSLLTTALRLALVAAAGVAVGSFIGTQLNERVVAPARRFEQTGIDRVLQSGSASDVTRAILAIQTQLTTKDPLAQAALLFDVNGVRTTLEQQRDALNARLAELGDTSKDTNALAREGGAVAVATKVNADRHHDQQARAVASSLAALTRIPERVDGVKDSIDSTRVVLKGKDFSPTINVRTQSNLYIAGRTVQAIITQQQLKVGTGPQES